MTFIITLAHFCEVHGPSMIMCTQVVSSQDVPHDHYGSKISAGQLCESCQLSIPSNFTKEARVTGKQNSELTLRPSSPQTSKTSLSTGSENSKDMEQGADTSRIKLIEPSAIQTKSMTSDCIFISTQFPTSQARYSSLRHIIMRVFTIETSSDIDKPLLFGDRNTGYSMTLLFKLYDKTARGSERKYALIVTSDKEEEIFQNYSIILVNLTEIVKKISKRAVRNDERRARMDANSNEIYLRRSTNVPKPKGLAIIMDDAYFFVRLHLLFSLLLDQLK